MPLHYIAWREALGEWNCGFEAKLFHEWGGVPIVEIVAALNKQRGLNMPVETVAGRKENLYFQLLPRLKAVPEVLEHIEAYTARFPLLSFPAARWIRPQHLSRLSIFWTDGHPSRHCRQNGFGKSAPTLGA